MKSLLLVVALLWPGGVSGQGIEKSASAQSVSDAVAGKWRGPWDSRGRNSGEMEIDARTVDGSTVEGRMRASFINPTKCSTDWEPLSGSKKGAKYFVRYDLGGVCGKVDAVFSIEGNVLSGTWNNEHGRNGGFRLVRE
jgi:hypothetical protein